jgi:hypothetical protein
MGESNQPKPSPADGVRHKIKIEDAPRHDHVPESAEDERLNGTPDAATNDAPSRLLNPAPSALLRRRPAPLAPPEPRSAPRSDPARPSLRGRDFSGLPAHTAGHPTVQPKLAVGPAGDRFEQEADRVAEQVMATPAPVAAPGAPTQPPAAGGGGEAGGVGRDLTGSGKPVRSGPQSWMPQRQTPEQEEEGKVQAKPLAAAITPLVQRVAEEEEEEASAEQPAQEEDEIRTKRGPAADGFEASDEFESRLAAQRGGGRPLPAVQRAFMEPRFGADFSGVRVHTGGEAAQLNRAISTRAFTHGQDIFLGDGQADLESSAGQRLLAHELTHVVQQGGDVTTPERVVSMPGEPAGPEATDLIAGLTQRNHIRPVGKAGSGTILRQASAQSETGQTEEEPGFWGSIGGGLMGEFREDPTYAMMGVDLGVSLIPILDQVSDVRDIIAHLYYLIFRKQYDRFMRWVGLVFTLIGLIPEVGSAIKSASKFIIRGIGEALSHLGEILRPLQRLLPDIVNLGRLRAYVTRNWDRWIAIGMAAWSRTVDRVTTVVNAIPSFLSRRLQFLRDGIARVRQIAPQKLQEAFAWVRRQWDSIMERLERRESGAGAEAAGTGTAKQLPATHGTAPVSPELAAGFAAKQIQHLPRLLGKPFTQGEIAILGSLWQQTTKAGDVARLNLLNSRRLFNNHRKRFWKAVAENAQARAIFTNAGTTFGRPGTAPFLKLPSGQRIRLTIDHIIERQTAPGRALDPANLRLMFERENTVVARLLHQLDPFQTEESTPLGAVAEVLNKVLNQ